MTTSPFPWPNTSSATYELPDGVSIVSGLGEVSFDDWGAPASTHVITLTDGEHTRLVSITGFTGLVP